MISQKNSIRMLGAVLAAVAGVLLASCSSELPGTAELQGPATGTEVVAPAPTGV